MQSKQILCLISDKTFSSELTGKTYLLNTDVFHTFIYRKRSPDLFSDKVLLITPFTS